MLVYANQMTFSGEDAEKAILKGVREWLKEQLGFSLPRDQLKTSGRHKGKGTQRGFHLEIYTAAEQMPSLYSWVLTVPDRQSRGRKWSVELGLKISEDIIDFSCVLKMDELSALVPTLVMASKPRVVKYVIRNIRKSKNAHLDEKFIGTSIKEIGGDIQFYHDLLFEIERAERHYPLVLVSPNRSGKYLVNCDRLQGELVGLAQVIKVVPEFDRYKMVEILEKRWSAWDGTINIIHIPRAEYVRSRHFLSEEIETWGNTQQDRISHLLAWVTSDTNIVQRKSHIHPDGVKQTAFRRRIEIEAIQRRISEMKNAELRTELSKARNRITKQNEYFEQLVEENSQKEMDNLGLQQQLKNFDDANDRKDFSIKVLKEQLENSKNQKTTDNDVKRLFELACRKYQPNPEECLNSLEEVFGNNCVILDSAKRSAQDANAFRKGRVLLDMLKKLVVDYRQELIEGGDAKARCIFGKNEYAANESETVMKKKSMRRARTFKYEGRDVEMFRHLKIGFANDVTRTIRVHFYWDSDREKIVIGYCGEHLPVSNC